MANAFMVDNTKRQFVIYESHKNEGSQYEGTGKGKGSILMF
jgi:hypothetical protein